MSVECYEWADPLTLEVYEESGFWFWKKRILVRTIRFKDLQEARFVDCYMDFRNFYP